MGRIQTQGDSKHHPSHPPQLWRQCSVCLTGPCSGMSGHLNSRGIVSWLKLHPMKGKECLYPALSYERWQEEITRCWRQGAQAHLCQGIPESRVTPSSPWPVWSSPVLRWSCWGQLCWQQCAGFCLSLNTLRHLNSACGTARVCFIEGD